MLHRRDEQIRIEPPNPKTLRLPNQFLPPGKPQDRAIHCFGNRLGKSAHAIVGRLNRLGLDPPPHAIHALGQRGQRMLFTN